MTRSATLVLLAILLASPAFAQAARVHNTGTAALRVFNYGYFGANTGVQTDSTFRFGGFSPLYEGQLLVGISATQVSGQPYSDNPDGMSPNSGFEWSLGTGPTAVAPPAPFTQAFETSYTDGGIANANQAGIRIAQRTLSRTGDPFVIVEVSVTSTTARPSAYVGMFADFDVEAAALDGGGFDAATRTVYTYNAATGTTGNRNYYGVTLLGAAAQSGWSVSAATTETGLYTALTRAGVATAVGADRRMVIGAGPFALSTATPQVVRFAYVGGATLAALTANAATARGLFATAGEGGPDAATGLELGAAVPNPATSQAAFSVTLDAAQTVRLSVVDVLGREVAVVADGARGAGTFTERVDTAALPSGVYVARLTADGRSVTRRFTVAH